MDCLIPTMFPREYYQKVPVEIIEAKENNIPILMYHSIDSPKYWIDSQTFRNHLKLLYNAGFTTIKLQDYLQNNFSHVPEGRKPVILTFDDQWGSQFYYESIDGIKVSNQSAVGILEEFAQLHPLFGKSAVFYLFFHRLPFQSYPDHTIWRKKISYLVNNGFEVGCHTFDHSIMTNMKPYDAQKNLTLFYQKLKPLVGNHLQYTMTLTYPGGYTPKILMSIETFSFQGFPLLCGLLASGGCAKVPVSANLSQFILPRIEGSTENILSLIKQPTFKVQRKIVHVPKIFADSPEFITNWIHPTQNKNTIIFRELTQ